MGVFGNFVNMFHVPDDDEYDDYEDDGYEDDYEEEKETRKHLFSGNHKKEDAIETDLQDGKAEGGKAVRPRKVVPIRAGSSRQLEVVVIRPENMEDSSEITDTLLVGRAVVLNLEGIHVEVAQRIIDYSAGSCYAMRGNLRKITNYIFLVTPPNVEISGDVQDLLTAGGATGAAGGIDLSSFKEGLKF